MRLVFPEVVLGRLFIWIAPILANVACYSSRACIDHKTARQSKPIVMDPLLRVWTPRLRGPSCPAASERRIQQLVGAIRAKAIGEAPFKIIP